MARLPEPGKDAGNWGDILNSYLEVAHQTDGSLKTISQSNVANLTDDLAAKYVKPSGGIPSSDLTAAVQASLSKSDNAVQKGDIVFNVKDYGAKGDGSTDDTAAIQAAIAAVQNASGGTVFFPQGTYSVASSRRTATVTSVTGTTLYSSSATNSDVGSYVLGQNIQVRTPKITSVNPGVSFTVDVAPAAIPTSVYIVKPALVLPEAIRIEGCGATYTGDGFGGGNPATSKILDKGNGVTCLIIGNGDGTGNASSRYAMQDIAIWGNNGSTFCGLYVGNMAWFLEMENCDVSHHGTAGMVLDANVNSHDIRNTTFLRNGSSSATSVTGGVITQLFWSQPSAAANFYNCFFNQNYGWGIAGGSAAGAFGVSLFGCQFNNTMATSAAGSGTSAALQTHGNADGACSIYGGWSESAALYDLFTTGEVIVSGFTMASAMVTNHWYINGGTASAIGCVFENLISAGDYAVSLNNGGNINWMSCFVGDNAFYAGSPANSYMNGMGSSASAYFGKVGIGTTPADAMTVKGDFNVEDIAASKQYRFRTSGSALDLDSAGANLYLSVYSNPDFSGTQRTYGTFGHDGNYATMFKYWEWKDASYNTKFSIDPDNNSVNFNNMNVLNLTGDWVSPPASATSTGTPGQRAYDNSYIYVCTATNTWRRITTASW